MKKELSVKEALLVFVSLLLIISICVIGVGMSPIFPVLCALGLLIGWSKWRGASWDKIHEGIIEGVKTGIVPMVIFILIGALIAVWIASGVIPTMMYVGFSVISTKIFLPSAFVSCALVGISIGSAFTTVSTIGLALMGMGISMGFNSAILAGAIISGAVFGDKMSPLSDTTNLASAVAGSDLFKHIRNMMWTTVPAFVISFILYAVIGFQTKIGQTELETKQFLEVLQDNFAISWWAILPILLLVLCSIKRVPAIASLLVTILVSSVMYMFQIKNVDLKQLSTILENGFVSKTGMEQIDALLTRGGIQSMMWSVSLILLTLSLGGLLMKMDVISVLMTPLAHKLKSTGSLVAATVFSGALANLMIGEQYLSIILPGRAFKESYDKAGLAPEVLSRALEDSGTVLNSLIPWGVSGVFMASTLQVSTLDYAPFSFFILLCPILSILSGIIGIGINRLASNEKVN
ncbi:Na+/H+ antiporter NhaC [Enterococcus haemoperoxidus ATCC BAA-382]|uniref:Na+/H+ antiporter NhaC n=1 Tax=Enterococcus haemoperoxidus ATCC BAA-382 TaxID=1158608 RepID=R2SBA6_9ENTE|nr:Na+/H+ antiporter NhaC [Enterococcus haemoperoxidus]EOH92815.1 Na+/H+ antiporter NhaC [Enterococcus haemoperoxidus ATCC BAA-382]EOT61558.1 Na+/H+ antiporter NhaC [Enterococcus haemoperoxidus ATCC BAA-382]OJG55391.1 Na+/H+ antiporter NhaC [Enterococcus haemoperoxidus]